MIRRLTRRLAGGGRLIDRATPMRFSFDGKTVEGFRGDTLASALLAAGHGLMGRSFKYHRPRGPVAAGPEEPNALMGIGHGGRLEPNLRATEAELFDGMQARSQNRWPSLAFDLGAVAGAFAPFLPAGFYYKTFLWPRPFWKHIYEPLIRRSAGLGRHPTEADPDRYEQAYAHAETVVVGGGIAGLAAALSAARAGGRAGGRVILLEQSPHWGGRAPVDGAVIGGLPAETWVAASLVELRAMPQVTLRLRCRATGLYDHGYLLAEERIAENEPGAFRPRRRLWRIRAGRTIMATGAIERPLAFAGNDRPGVMLAGAMRDYVVNWAVAPAARSLIVTNNDDAYRTALALHAAGAGVAAILDARTQADGALPAEARRRGIAVLTGTGIAKVHGRRQVTGVTFCDQSGNGAPRGTLLCDGVGMSGGWSPAVHLWSHSGGRLNWDVAAVMFRPDASRPPTGADGQPLAIAVGAANATMQTGAALAEAHRLGGSTGPAPMADDQPEAPIAPVWVMPAQAGPKLRARMWLDFQNDVKVSDVELAAREGYASVEHAKRYTTLGMATDQGKLSNINGLAVLSQALGQPIPDTGTTTFRPPYAPLTMGAIAAEAKGELFQPLRRTPIHGWHEANGAYWEPVGLWRRPFCYPRKGEGHADAVAREVLAARNGAALLDASTLGKLLVKGPDAGRFLDMLYTGVMSSLPIGRCRYGLMCSENGFLIDDGVVVRLSEDSWLCHTTTGGADRIHAHMEDWLQCEWWDWQAHVLNLTEQFAQVAVVGPKSRAVLERLGGMDLSREALPFMAMAEGTLAGIPVRVFRISFSGELSFEVAVPAGRGLEFWNACLAAGAEFGVTPYGTEALHVLRAEKGFIMIGDETDGTVIPQDLGLDWAISKKKPDYLGKRAQLRSHMTDPDRWRLVGLQTLDGAVLPEGAYAVADGVNANGQRNTQGRVTSSYHSPTLGRGIAMGLVRRGPERMGDELDFPSGRRVIRALIVSPVFFDPKGERQNV